MADYNNAVVYHDNNGIEYAIQLKKTLEKGFQRDCFLINFDNPNSNLNPTYALKTSKYVIFLFNSMFPNEKIISESKVSFEMEKCVISMNLADKSIDNEFNVFQLEFNDNYTLSKNIELELEKINDFEKRSADYIEANSHFHIGSIFFNFKKYDEALKNYKKAVKIMPDFLDAINNVNILSNIKLSKIGENNVKEEFKIINYRETKIEELIPDIFESVDENFESFDGIKIEENSILISDDLFNNVESSDNKYNNLENNLSKIENDSYVPIESIEVSNLEKFQVDLDLEKKVTEEIKNDVESFEYLPKNNTKEENPTINKEIIENVSLISDVTLKNLKDYEENNNKGLKFFESANSYYESGEFEKAEEEYINAIQNDFENSELHNNYGCLLEQFERFEEAENEFKKAILLDKNNSKAQNNIATLFARLDNYAKAEEHYKKAIEINPCYWEAIYNLGAMYATIKRYDEAIIQVKSIIKIFRSEGNIKFVLELKKLVKHLKKLKIQNYNK
ncbi:Tetratricopeptide TPR_2 repeat protein [Methanococcus vannielii SB]|uniref:Tetratricopeptide TPR_2 repeat protein n=1 Tax=Methanococcus vannielii (strain ATCC 35089 / DSM 1224 / JCM 13029 / OCM 148 / SB) TaxID=406327 RepID=A6UN90_METVS|nr:tetratricopeptide repeat protein [Methanococcus vannielii]ABR53962.1 Tetratricopeptide TPR_2 repeat protein [Methanococcus vannielii SB]